jgi:putative ABC transport system substrate-binding protein
MWRHRALAVIVASLTLFASRAEAQQQVHRIGYLGNTPVPESMQAWLQGLHEHGYVEGQNLQIEYRWVQGRTDVSALVAELIASNPEVIVTSQSNPAIIIHTTAPSIPVL